MHEGGVVMSVAAGPGKKHFPTKNHNCQTEFNKREALKRK